MADLKAGTTVGGALLWNASNLKLTPVDGAAPKLYYEQTNRIYTTGDKPTPEEIDTVSASRGGTYQKPVIFTEGLKLPKASSGDMPSIVPGNGDSATYNATNMDISPWWGLGLRNDSAAGIKGRTIVFDVRSGSMISKGTLQADNGFIDGSSVVWSNAHKPTNVEMNAVQRTGGDNMEGQYNLSGTIIMAAGNNSGIRARMNYNSGQHINLISMGGDDVVSIGQNHTQVKGMTLSLPAGMSPQVRWSSDPKDIFRIYHEGFKPDATVVGLSNVINALQLKHAGDVARTSDFEFRNLKLAADPTNDEHAVRLAYFNSNAFVQRDGISLISTSDWNDTRYHKPGSYNVQGGTGPNSVHADLTSKNHALAGNAQWGVLTVSWVGGTNATGTTRMVQEFKSIQRGVSAWRSCEKGTSWSPWNYQWDTIENDKLYLSKTGDDTTAGSINLGSTSAWYKQSGIGVICLRPNVGSANNVIVLGDTNISNIEFRPATANGLIVNSRDSGNNTWRVFHQGFKPDNVDVGLGKVLNVEQVPLVSTKTRGPTQNIAWVKMGEVRHTSTGNSFFQFSSYGNAGVGATTRSIDTVELSGRFIDLQTSTVTITAANIRNQMRHMKSTFEPSNSIARYGCVNKPGLIELWMKLPAWYSSDTKYSVFCSGLSTSFIEDANYVTTEPAGIVYVPIDYQYSTDNKPGKADVGLDKVENYKALPIDGSQPLNGTLDITNAARSLYYQSKGFSGLTPATSGSTVVQWRGSYLNWNQDGNGSTDIINHPGAASGGFKFWQGTPNSSAAYKQIASISSTGMFTGLSFMATVDSMVDLDQLDIPTNQNVWDDGIQIMQGAGTANNVPRGGPYPGNTGSALGTGLKFKSSANRHGQIWLEPDSTQWFRTLRSSDQGGTSGWIANLSNRNFKNYLDPEYISAGAVIDFGVV
ncbi:putative tail fiber protein [Serratia phage SP1]|nr:putative tail fiber protein [Serratia phage SP1]